MGFYKHFVETPSPQLAKVFNHIRESGQAPPFFSVGHIVIISKAEKDPISCKSYHPISLLNTDAKDYARVLATCMEEFMPRLIHSDQVVFIKERQGADAMRKTLNVMEHSRGSDGDHALLNMDSEKAFDRVEWAFLWAILRNMGFGERFIRGIQAIYKNLKCRVASIANFLKNLA